MFPKMQGISLILNPQSAFSWGMVRHQKATGFMILRRKGSFSVGMLFLMSGNLKGCYAKACPFLDLNFDQDFENGNVAGNRLAEEVNHETETPLRTSTRVKRQVERYGEWVYNTNSIVTKAEPTSLSEALGRKDCKLWKEAADSEFKSLVENDVWNLKKLPEGSYQELMKTEAKYDGWEGHSI